eukprot:Opistho-2@36657
MPKEREKDRGREGRRGLQSSPPFGQALQADAINNRVASALQHLSQNSLAEGSRRASLCPCASTARVHNRSANVSRIAGETTNSNLACPREGRRGESTLRCAVPPATGPDEPR